MNVRASRDRIVVTKENPETAKVVALGKGRGNDKDEVFPLEVTMAFDDRRARRVASGTHLKSSLASGVTHKRFVLTHEGVAERRGMCHATQER
ncbi:MAG TPA: hypothetical protein VGX46_08825 [Vicinamibacterales bacterium]|jgi:hypothetical protein|nr:hypothetical protein [Vicinamibacterales bacterium]